MVYPETCDYMSDVRVRRIAHWELSDLGLGMGPRVVLVRVHTRHRPHFDLQFDPPVRISRVHTQMPITVVRCEALSGYDGPYPLLKG